MSDLQIVSAEIVAGSEKILTPDALAFVAALQRKFGPRRNELLADRHRRQAHVTATHLLDFRPETADISSGEWKVAAAPADLTDRRVEMTGPTDRKMTINALNSGAKVWLADMEDASTPHWRNVVGGQVNLYDAIRRQISFTADGGKSYTLVTDRPLATIVMRPRGWHFDDTHLLIDGAPTVGALVDFGLYFFHNAAQLLAQGSGPYFYLPKMESYLEARLWNEVFTYAQQELGVPHGSVRATVLIETIPAAFEMDEILYELRDHASGLNAGRWDYLFSIIKYFRNSGADFVLPDRNAVKMTAPFMRSYAQLLVQTCHRRGAYAIGGMSAFIPSRTDAQVNETALAQVRADKEREAAQGFDGSWVAHPDLVPVCCEVFDSVLGDRPNQIERVIDPVVVTAADLLNIKATPGSITAAGLRGNVEVALVYLESWLRGGGAVGIHNLMEDAATAEIARSQIWQWVHNRSRLADGDVVTAAMVREIVAEEVGKIRAELGEVRYQSSMFEQASAVFEDVALDDDYAEFLTLPAYAALN